MDVFTEARSLSQELLSPQGWVPLQFQSSTEGLEDSQKATGVYIGSLLKLCFSN